MPHRIRHFVLPLVAMCFVTSGVNGQQLDASPEIDVVSNVVSDIAAHLTTALRDKKPAAAPASDIYHPVVQNAGKPVMHSVAADETQSIALASYEEVQSTQQVITSPTKHGIDNAVVQLADDVSAPRSPTKQALTTTDRRFPLQPDDSPESAGSPNLVRKLMVAMACAVCSVVLLTLTTRFAGSARKTKEDEAMQLVSTFRLAPRCTLSLLRVEGKSVLVSRDATGVRQLLVLQKDFETMLETPVDDEIRERS